jgi:2-polyprenyl-3-methyl-5-hydroxy-6-metoxy-1,4-benzoquinol methylase
MSESSRWKDGVDPSISREQGFIPYMAAVLKSRLSSQTIAKEMGFKGFQGKSVLDVGCRDGRFINVFRDLGASAVYGIDPDSSEMSKAVSLGILDTQHAIPAKVEHIPPAMKGKFNVATVLNYNIPLQQTHSFLDSVSKTLKPDGQVVITVAENDMLRQIEPALRDRFKDIKIQRLEPGVNDYPHANLVIANKKK